MSISKNNEKLTLRDILLLIFLFFIPAFLINVTQWQYSYVEESEAQTVVAHYMEYWKIRSGRLELSFSDHKNLKVFMNRYDKVGEKLRKVSQGTEFTMKLHPASHYIMSIQTPDTEVLAFDLTRQEMKSERTAFLWIGGVLFAIEAALFLPALFTDLKEMRKKRGHTTDGFIIKRD